MKSLETMLTQIHDGKKRVIKCYKKIYLKEEIHYCFSRKELLAIISAVDHFYKYMWNQVQDGLCYAEIIIQS